MLNDCCEQVTSEKLLEVRIDINVTFDDLIDELSKMKPKGLVYLRV